MKKIVKTLVAGILTATVAVAASASVFAAGINDAEQKILDELHTTVKLAGNEKPLPINFVNQAENYFNTVEITEEESKEIIAKIEAAKDYLTSTGVANYEELTDAQLDTFVSKCKEITGVISLMISYEKSEKRIDIVDKDGKVVFTATVGKSSSTGNGGSSTDNSKSGGSSSGSNTTSQSGSSSNSSAVDSNPIKTTGADFNIPGVTAVAGVGILLVSAAGIYLVKTKKSTVSEIA